MRAAGATSELASASAEFAARCSTVGAMDIVLAESPGKGRVFAPISTDPELCRRLCIACTWGQMAYGVPFVWVNWSLELIASTACTSICNRSATGLHPKEERRLVRLKPTRNGAPTCGGDNRCGLEICGTCLLGSTGQIVPLHHKPGCCPRFCNRD
jgi:hypothetical protein